MLLRISGPSKFQFRVIPDLKSIFSWKGGDIHYIGGAEVLPAPLSPLREAELIGKLGTEDEGAAKGLLVEHNLRLVV